jgi:hypothetical protein
MYKYQCPSSTADAVRIQKEMRSLVRLEDDLPQPTRLADKLSKIVGRS